MMGRYCLIGVQLVCALTLLVAVGLAARHNQWGQNIINCGAVLCLINRLENIVAFYRFYVGQSYLENQATVMIALFLGLGRLGQRFNPTTNQEHQILNNCCFIGLITLLVLNLLFYLMVLIFLVTYMFRQLYRLMKGTILSSQANLEEEEMNQIRQSARPFQQLQRKYPMLGVECSICLSAFEPQQQCIVLPGCQHCFHEGCINQWLTSKSSCPYCRNNIRLGLMSI